MREGDFRIPSGCAISGIFDSEGKKISGSEIIDSIAVMHERSNGLGGGFAGYGIYPEYKDFYALHIFYDDVKAKNECEAILEKNFDIVNLSRIPTRNNNKITDAPLIWRYFALPLKTKLENSLLSESEYTARVVISINNNIKGAYIFSSGKNMGVFKAVGYPEDVGDFFMLENYSAYCWTAHGRYPTNTPGWWGGAHPFGLLDCTVVHNGEISSYDANRRFIESYGYKCNLLTDTEVISYMFDFLSRKKDFSFSEIASIIAPPFWSQIEKMNEEEKKKFTYIRNNFSGFLITGPFSILVGGEGKLMALNDRLKLRSMVVGRKGSRHYVASEEGAIRKICPTLDDIYSPGGGEAVIFELKKEKD